jgi:hypothetical protein
LSLPCPAEEWGPAVKGDSVQLKDFVGGGGHQYVVTIVEGVSFSFSSGSDCILAIEFGPDDEG